VQLDTYCSRIIGSFSFFFHFSMKSSLLKKTSARPYCEYIFLYACLLVLVSADAFVTAELSAMMLYSLFVTRPRVSSTPPQQPTAPVSLFFSFGVSCHLNSYSQFISSARPLNPLAHPLPSNSFIHDYVFLFCCACLQRFPPRLPFRLDPDLIPSLASLHV